MLSRRRILWLGAAVLAASALTACTVSLSGGLAGIVSTLALLGLLFGLGATQSGCSERLESHLVKPLKARLLIEPTHESFTLNCDSQNVIPAVHANPLLQHSCPPLQRSGAHVAKVDLDTKPARQPVAENQFVVQLYGGCSVS